MVSVLVEGISDDFQPEMATAQMTVTETKTEKESKRGRKVEKRGPAVAEGKQECAQSVERMEGTEAATVPFIKIENLEVRSL